MAIEIERKYLVTNDDWRASVRRLSLLTQFYVSVDPERTVRVRSEGESYILCIKGKTTGMSRVEVETAITKEQAKELHGMRAPGTHTVDKIRHIVMHEASTWEIDEFVGVNGNLIVAEIELISESEPFFVPSWLGREVTNDYQYSNSSLAIKPYSMW